MTLRNDWLWDRRITVQGAKKILKDTKNEHFLSLAALLLSRKNDARQVFRNYISPEIFLRKWRDIKKKMRMDYWNDPRIEFWQAVYEKLKEKYPKRVDVFATKAPREEKRDALVKEIATQIRQIRKQKKLTQRDLAKKLKVSQQVISRIERARENISLLTLKKIVRSLGAKLNLEIKV